LHAPAATSIDPLSLHDALPICAIKGALNTVFGWINRNMIRHINKVTEPFGLEIPSLPKLHKGGHVPGRGEKPYMLLGGEAVLNPDRKSTRLNSSHVKISYAVFC